MKIKTQDLTGTALDWAVAMELNLNEEDYVEIDNLYGPLWRGPEYSTDWAHGGPIIEQQGIALYLYGDYQWNAHVGGRESVGPTPLIAAMRCFVASHLGDEIEVPEELK